MGEGCLIGSATKAHKRPCLQWFREVGLTFADALTTFDGMKRKQAKQNKIETVTVGNARVKIYRRTRTVSGNEYPTFEVCDYTAGRRKLRSFADHGEALKEALRIARLLATGDAVAAAMSGKEAASFGRCMELLRSTGEPPELACARYAEALGVLGNGNLLTTAAKFYLERHPNTLPQITLADAAAEMIERRRENNASGPYLADLRSRAGRFCKMFAVHPASVTTAAATSPKGQTQWPKRSVTMAGMVTLWRFGRRPKWPAF